MWRISIAICIGFMYAQYANAECNICNANNGAACTSNTTFQLCFNGAPQDKVYSCVNVGDVCTTLGAICADPQSNSQIQAACGNTEQCGLCQGVNDGAYTCTSQNTFGMCLSNQLTTVIGECPANQICLTSRANAGISPCVNECLRNINDMCDIASSTTTPPATATTVTSSSSDTTQTSVDTPTATATPTPTTASTASTGATSSAEDSVCASRTQVGRYPYPNDTTCTNYVYCYVGSATGSLLGRAMSCPVGRYFNPSINNCQATLPVGCT